VVHHLDDEVAAVHSFAEVVRPGGRVAVVEGGLGTRFLPSDCGIGEPGLETRLAAAQETWFWSEVRPTAGTVRTGVGWGEVLRVAGLVDVESRSFLLDVPAPLGATERDLVRSVLSVIVDRVADHLGRGDRATLARLVDPEDPLGVMRRDDVYMLDVRTVTSGPSRRRRRRRSPGKGVAFAMVLAWMA
jgi:hypothetical protein